MHNLVEHCEMLGFLTHFIIGFPHKGCLGLVREGLKGLKSLPKVAYRLIDVLHFLRKLSLHQLQSLAPRYFLLFDSVCVEDLLREEEEVVGITEGLVLLVQVVFDGLFGVMGQK